jgi:uncharacterized protein YbaR (Trm112 family)
VLRCPATGRRLREAEEGVLRSEDGSRAYPVVDGVPILIDGARSLFSIVEVAASAERARGGRPGVLRRALRSFIPETTTNVAVADRFERFGELVSASAWHRSARVLVVGGGRARRRP